MTWDFQRGDEPLTIREAVHQAIGGASVCWDGPIEGTFQEEVAREIADALLTEVEIYAAADEPHLGLATTERLLGEIETRCQIGGEAWLAQKAQDLRSMMTPDQLAYRTVDGG